METTRRYPRTAAEAFKGAEYASALTVYDRRTFGPALRAAAFIVLILFLIGAVCR